MITVWQGIYREYEVMDVENIAWNSISKYTAPVFYVPELGNIVKARRFFDVSRPRKFIDIIEVKK